MNVGEDLMSAVMRAYAGVVAWLATLPEYLLLIVLLAPTVMALLTRNLLFVVLTALLNIAGLFVLASGDAGVSQPLGLVTLAAAFAIALYGIGDRRHALRLAEIAARVDHMDRQIVVFLKALDRRSELMDRREADQHRTASAPGATTPPPMSSPLDPSRPVV